MRTLIVTAVLAAGVLAAGPAHAETYRHRDPAHDVAAVVSQSCPHCATVTAAPHDRTEDITGAVIDYRRDELRMSLDLRGHGKPSVVPGAGFLIATPADLPGDASYSLFLSRTSAGRVRSQLYDSTGVLHCRDKRASYDRHQRIWAVTLGAGCLGAPDWVRVDANVSRTDPEQENLSYQDDAYARKIGSPFELYLSPRVHRG